MITDKIVRSKRIKDPLFSSVKLYLADLADKMIAQKGLKKYDEAIAKYYDLKNEDVQIEPPTLFPNGKLIACFLSRRTEYFYADAELKMVDLPLIYKDHFIDVPSMTLVEFEAGIGNGAYTFGLYHINDQNKYVLLLNPTKHTVDDCWKALGEIYWDEIELDIEIPEEVLVNNSQHSVGLTTLVKDVNPNVEGFATKTIQARTIGTAKFKSPNLTLQTLDVYYPATI